MSNFIYNNGFTSLNELININATDVQTSSLSSDSYNGVDKQNIIFCNNLSAPVQDQINTLSAQIANINGNGVQGGFFTIWFESNNGLNLTNYFQWSMGGNNQTTGDLGIPIPINCVLTNAYFKSSGAPTNGQIGIQINGMTQYTMNISTNNWYSFTPNINITASDKINCRTLLGSGGGNMRIFLSFSYSVVGLNGVSPVLSVGSTTTLSAGSNASVSIGGTSSNPVLYFSIPQGAKGEQGDRGPTGDKGDKGNTGNQGPQGEQGPAGSSVDIGAVITGVLSAIGFTALQLEIITMQGEISVLEAQLGALQLEVADNETNIATINAKIQPITNALTAMQCSKSFQIYNGSTQKIDLNNSGNSTFQNGIVINGSSTINSNLNLNGELISNNDIMFSGGSGYNISTTDLTSQINLSSKAALNLSSLSSINITAPYININGVLSVPFNDIFGGAFTNASNGFLSQL